MKSLIYRNWLLKKTAPATKPYYNALLGKEQNPHIDTNQGSATFSILRPWKPLPCTIQDLGLVSPAVTDECLVWYKEGSTPSRPRCTEDGWVCPSTYSRRVSTSQPPSWNMDPKCRLRLPLPGCSCGDDAAPTPAASSTRGLAKGKHKGAAPASLPSSLPRSLLPSASADPTCSAAPPACGQIRGVSIGNAFSRRWSPDQLPLTSKGKKTAHREYRHRPWSSDWGVLRKLNLYFLSRPRKPCPISYPFYDLEVVGCDPAYKW